MSNYNPLRILGEEANKAAARHNIKGTGRFPGQLDELDAFRHTYISAVVTRRAGRRAAHASGEFVELMGDFTQSSEAREMDEHNNNMGRLIGEVASSDEEAASLVAQALRNGQLRVVEGWYRQDFQKSGAATLETFDLARLFQSTASGIQDALKTVFSSSTDAGKLARSMGDALARQLSK